MSTTKNAYGKVLGAKGAPRSYRLPIWADMAIRHLAYDAGLNQNAVVSMLVCEALKARGYTRDGKLTTQRREQ
jgi:hypothetical protein